MYRVHQMMTLVGVWLALTVVTASAEDEPRSQGSSPTATAAWSVARARGTAPQRRSRSTRALAA